MSRSTLTVFYGPKPITDGNVLNRLAEAIDGHKDFVVSNQSMGGDPAVGTYKTAMVYYSLAASGSPLRGRVAGEGQSLGFGTDIAQLVYRPKIVADGGVYAGAYDAFRNKRPFPVTNGSMGGDPQVGTVKWGQAFYYTDGGMVVEESRREGEHFEWDAKNWSWIDGENECGGEVGKLLLGFGMSSADSRQLAEHVKGVN